MSLTALIAILVIDLFLSGTILVAVHMTASRAMDLVGASTTIRVAWASTFVLLLVCNSVTAQLLAVSL